MINSIENGAEFRARDIDLLKAMQMIRTSLNNITNEVIKNCFRKAFFKFDSNIDSDSGINEEFDSVSTCWSDILQQTDLQFDSFDDYVNCDENECTTDIIELTDEEIIAEVCGNSSIQTVSDSEDETLESPKVSTNAAFNHLIELQKHFWQIGINTFDDTFAKMQKTLTDNTFKTLKQTKIDNYFQNMNN
jgi:hypothetical protein